MLFLHLHLYRVLPSVGYFKGPLKYLVATLRGCYASAISLPVSAADTSRAFFPGSYAARRV